MERLKTKSLESIEGKMRDMDEASIRYRILQNAKNFKTSWIELGRALYTAWKDKLYKDWGYKTFEAYTSKEIGIKKQTAIKLLRSYYFLEKEEPEYLQKDYVEAADPSLVPTYEAVNVLRLAKNKKALDDEDYSSLKKYVFEMGRDARDVKKDLTAMIRQREELEPEEARKKKRVAVLRRYVSTLKALQRDIEISKLLPQAILKEAASLVKKIEAELA